MRFENFILNEAAGDASNTTRLQESLCCVAFSMAQKKGDITLENLLDRNLFMIAYAGACDVDASDEELFEFVTNNPDWGNSVVSSVNALRKSKWYKKSNYVFYRGTGFMNLIYNEFNKLKTADGIKMNNDKWNPGDIWASTTNLMPSLNSLPELNKFIFDSINKGTILPISLKKTKTAKVTFNGPGEPMATVSFSHVQKPASPFGTGVMIMTDKKGLGVNFRSFRISKQADITGEIVQKGGTARHGKVSSTDKRNIINDYKISQMSKSRIKALVSSDGTEELKNIVVDLWKQCGHNFSKSVVEKAWGKRANSMQDEVGYWQSIIHALEMGAFLNTHKSIANDIVERLFLSASSVSELSSHFIKIY